MAVAVVDEHIGADQIGGHEVGRELDALEVERQGAGDGAHQHGLAEPGHAFEKDVTARDHGRDDVLDDLVLADDELLHLGLEQIEPGTKMGRALFDFVDGPYGFRGGECFERSCHRVLLFMEKNGGEVKRATDWPEGGCPRSSV